MVWVFFFFFYCGLNDCKWWKFRWKTVESTKYLAVLKMWCIEVQEDVEGKMIQNSDYIDILLTNQGHFLYHVTIKEYIEMNWWLKCIQQQCREKPPPCGVARYCIARGAILQIFPKKVIDAPHTPLSATTGSGYTCSFLCYQGNPALFSHLFTCYAFL